MIRSARLGHGRHLDAAGAGPLHRRDEQRDPGARDVAGAAQVQLDRAVRGVDGVEQPGAHGVGAEEAEVPAERQTGAPGSGQHLPPGSVLADTGAAFAVVAASRDPQRFLITPDDGFAAALADPPAHGVRYLLRNERGGVDTVRSTWPDLGGPAGPSWARLVAGHPGAGPWSYSWTLWEVGPA